MNKKIMGLAILAVLILACDDSSNADNAASESGLVDTDISKTHGAGTVVDTALPACENKSQDSLNDVSSESWMPLDTVAWQSSDTVCFYNEFPYKDTICCFGERGTWLQRDEDGKYINVSGVYGVGFDSDTLAATVAPSLVNNCLATIGEERYQGVKIGSQVWLSENARGKGRCLNDDEENCKLFGTLMPYDKAKETCSGEYRLPSSNDVSRLLFSVGMVRERAFTKDVCGELPSETSYVNVPLFAESRDSLNAIDAYGFSFLMDGGIYEKNFDGSKLVYSSARTCFFLLSDEKSDYLEAFCYDVNEKKAYVAHLGKDAEVYARCIMK